MGWKPPRVTKGKISATELRTGFIETENRFVYPGIPDWNPDDLKRGKPELMDNPTYIEWMNRQLETEEETIQRLNLMKEEHMEWHRNTPGIFTCCIQVTTLSGVQGGTQWL